MIGRKRLAGIVLALLAVAVTVWMLQTRSPLKAPSESMSAVEEPVPFVLEEPPTSAARKEMPPAAGPVPLPDRRTAELPLEMLAPELPPQLIPEAIVDYVTRPRTPKVGTVKDRITQYAASVRDRLAEDFKRADIDYPPAELCYVGLKREDVLQIYARNKAERDFRLVKTYRIFAASGRTGPKLKEGDFQVPEGLYGIEMLNANSRYHLSLRINYPNREDRQRAREENRTDLGGDIMIHGSALSDGCLAMGDKAAEDLFILATLTGIEAVRVILAPWDLRLHDPPDYEDLPEWMPARYAAIKAALAELPLPVIEK